jgi:hypothetical protein
MRVAVFENASRFDVTGFERRFVTELRGMVMRQLVRRTVIVAAATSFLAFPRTSLAQKGGGSHGSSHASKGDTSSKPVHVKTYTKKDGTVVEEHDRKAATPKGESGAAATATAGSTPIRVYRDPVAGVMTFTNAPAPALPTLPSRAIPTTTTAPIRVAPAPKRTASASRSTSAVTPATRMIPPPPPAKTITGIARGDRGRIQRSAAARHAFARQTGYPNGRPGYVIDHIKPLACGGADAPSNMQWQTIAAAKAKDKVERVGCR